MCKYEMDQTRTLDTTERVRDAGQKDGRTDRQTDGQTDKRSETNMPPYNFVVWGYNETQEGICIALKTPVW